jgi:aerobic carbon-monoxide dehydrogenase medium subunit
MKDIEYFAPDNLEEALILLSDYGSKATILAGGTDLVPQINYHECRPEVLIYIGGLGLNDFQEENGSLLVAGTTPTARLMTHDWLQANAPALVEAAHLSGCDATRSVGTIGGNLANASPSADLVPPLLVADAQLRLASRSGEREVPIGEFFLGPGETLLAPGELIRAIVIPPANGRSVFLKLGKRKAMQCSVASVAACVDMDGQTCKTARIALGAMAPTPIRCPKAEAMISGKNLDRTILGDCARQAVEESNPIDDQRATAWYRRQAAVELVTQALAQASGLKL